MAVQTLSSVAGGDPTHALPTRRSGLCYGIP